MFVVWERVIICTNTRVVTYRVVITRHQAAALGTFYCRCGAVVHLHVITLSCLCIDARWMDGCMNRPSLVAMPKRKLVSNRKLLGLQLRSYSCTHGRCFAAMIKWWRRPPTRYHNMRLQAMPWVPAYDDASSLSSSSNLIRKWQSQWKVGPLSTHTSSTGLYSPIIPSSQKEYKTIVCTSTV